MSLDPEKLAAGLHEYLERAFAPIVRRLEKLESAENNFKYCGVYQRAMHYKIGNSVTFNGDLFIKIGDEAGEPAESKAWQLAVRKGKDAR